MIPNLTIDEEVITAWGKIKLHAIVYHHGYDICSGHYTAGIKMNETWFSVDDTRVSKNVKFTCTPHDSKQSCPYLLIYKKDSDVVTSMTPTITVSDESSRSTSTTAEPISVNMKPKNKKHAVEHIDLDPILIDENSTKNPVNTTVICAHCKNKITITEPKISTIKCTHCNFRSRVSVCDVIDERAKETLVTPESVVDETMNRQNP